MKDEKYEKEFERSINQMIRKSFMAGFEFGFLSAKDGARYWTTKEKAKEMVSEQNLTIKRKKAL